MYLLWILKFGDALIYFNYFPHSFAGGESQQKRSALFCYGNMKRKKGVWSLLSILASLCLPELGKRCTPLSVALWPPLVVDGPQRASLLPGRDGSALGWRVSGIWWSETHWAGRFPIQLCFHLLPWFLLWTTPGAPWQHASSGGMWDGGLTDPISYAYF